MPEPVEPKRTRVTSHDRGGADETTSLTAHRTDVPSFGPPAAVGEVGALGPYRVVKQLGAGGMGVVYLAVDMRLDRKLALKVMLPGFAADRDSKERFLREARAAAQITHENVVTVFEADECDGVPYIAMQLLQGAPLDDYLKRKGAPTLAHVVRIGCEAATGLAAAHEQGLVHRDIKPANLWLEAPNGRVKILDFGLAKPVETDADLTRNGAVVGTPAYMSPEQARAQKVDHRTDLFSLGAVLYRLCTGRTPFAGSTAMAVLVALGTEDPVPVGELNPRVPESLARLIHALLAKRSEHRPQTAVEVAEWLQAIGEELLSPSADPSALRSAVVPLSVTALPDDVFAHLHGDEDELTETELMPAALPPERRTAGKSVLVGVGGAVLLGVAVVAAVVASGFGRRDKPPAPVSQAPAPSPAPDPGPSTSVAPTPAKEPTSIFAALNLDRDALKGNWSWDKGALIVPSVSGADGSVSALVVPRTPPGEFDLTIAVERMAGTDCLGVWIPVGGKRVSVVLDGAGGTVSGLDAIDGKGPKENVTRTGGSVFPRRQVVRLEVTVRKARVTVSAAGRRLFEWSGDPEQLSDPRNFPRSAGLALWAWQSSFRVTELTLRTTDGSSEPGATAVDDALARAVLRRGGAIDCSAGGKEVRVSHVADLPAVGIQVRAVRLGTSRYSWDAALPHLPACDGVEIVRADHADLTDAGVAGLARFTKMSDLAVPGSRLTDAALGGIARFTGLKTLRVGEGQFSEPALNQFRAARKECAVVIVPGDRVAAEAVLVLNEQTAPGYGWPASVDLRTPDGRSSSVRSIAALPAGPLRVKSLVLPQLFETPAWRVATFQNLPELTTIHAWGCALTDEGLAHWSNLPKLQSAFLGFGYGITSAGARSLARFPALDELNLLATGCDDRATEALSGCKSLTKLCLFDTRISDASIPSLARLTELRWLGVSRTQMTADGVARLAEELPRCKIEWSGGVIEPTKK